MPASVQLNLCSVTTINCSTSLTQNGNLIKALKDHLILHGSNCILDFITLQKNVMPSAWKVSKCGVISGPNTGKYGPEITPYISLFSPITGKYEPEITPYLDTFPTFPI